MPDFFAHIFEVTCIDYSKKFLVSGSRDCKVILRDLQLKVGIKTFDSSTSTISYVHISENSNLLATTDYNYIIQVFSLENFCLLFTIFAHVSLVISLKFTENTRFFLSLGKNGCVCIFSGKNFIASQDNFFFPTTSSSTPNYIICASSKTVKVFSLKLRMRNLAK